jgi:hypothetical protein
MLWVASCEPVAVISRLDVCALTELKNSPENKIHRSVLNKNKKRLQYIDDLSFRSASIEDAALI